MNEWIDLSQTVSEDYLVFPGDEKLEIKQVKNIKDDGYNLSQLNMNMHIGTHIDFRSHVLELKNHEKIDFENFLGKGNVIRPAIINHIVSTKDLETKYNKLRNREKILFLDLNHTSQINTAKYYEQVVFEPMIFDFLTKNNISILGADIPNFSYVNEKNLRMHKDLLGEKIHLIENLTNLHLLNQHFYFIGLPLKIKNVEASMIRAIAKNL